MEFFSSYSGSDFLVFYVVMLLTCVAAGLWIPANLRPQGKRGEVDDLEEVAVLTGGADRLNVAVLSSLFAKGALESGDKKRLRVKRSEGADGDAERAVLAKVGDFTTSEAHKSIAAQAERVEARLIRRGLLMDSSERLRLRFLSALPYALLFLIGLYRQQAGAALGEPTGFLVVLLIVTFVFGLIRFFTGNKRTIAGQEVVKTMEENGSRLKRAPQANEAGFAVALFGTTVLVGTPWEPVHAARQAGSGGDAGYSGDSDGDGGGSGCGGGCGGCGG
ncbi:TIGR04222 domain-containing membrane protein [Erythrobacter sp. SCSIO 43205]|uniref:TIGR04222 domain-containing membrane protein n=1 Tax=Erythrobacter sp. SCSIO 43205 TaxID=2779361 RepID=UPI001CAA0EB9|nr:TIGR04222 domain-containing membrane protein [Erythrobacter sp. SCSIO 43205]UAB77370.1 TIGR04222 domain-containing membrane protein [Erythrobacter sp. SCSIO 43205]